MANLLTVNQLTKAYTDRVLFDHIDFGIQEGEKIGVIGINGTGKSTFLKILAGLEEPDTGEITKGTSVHIRYLPQNPVFQPGITVYDYVAAENTSAENQWTIEGEAKAILNRLGLLEYDKKIELLSGGQKKRAALAAALLASCEILILDEPTNHLDSEMILWLEDYLKARRGALVMVTHDRYFLDRICNKIVELDQSKLYSYKTNYAGFLEAKLLREEMEDAAERKRKSILRIEAEWIKRGARARSTKQKARIERYEELKSTSAPLRDSQVEMSSAASRLGKKTIELDGVGKAYEGHLLFQDFSYIFLKHDRIGILGHNGCGKSTLLKIICQLVKPDTGTVELGETVKIGYFFQENEYLDEKLRVIDYIRQAGEYIQTGEGLISASQMLERFLFFSSMQYSQIGKLSGGEKRRLYLLRILMTAPNVLILDEPTNDLDIQTLCILEDYLDSFAGIVITVSHDRYFIDRTASRIFAFEKGKIRQYEGGFSDYYAVILKERAEEPAAKSISGKKSEKITKPRAVKLKFTYQEQKDYERIEEDILVLEEKIQELNKQIIESATDFVRLNLLTEEKEETEKRLEEKMDRWMYLNDLAERIEKEN